MPETPDANDLPGTSIEKSGVMAAVAGSASITVAKMLLTQHFFLQLQYIDQDLFILA
jgi:hypothetical protein